MRVAYADPPYINQAKKLYGCEEIDHRQLIEKLETFDAWALSLSSPTLLQILSMCPKNVRVGAWVKPFCIFKPNVNPAYAWEPVIYKTGRKLGRRHPTVRDWVACNITLKKGLCGAKPEGFCFWIFELLHMQPEDSFFDLFPGTGAVTCAWEKWKEKYTLTPS